MGISVAQSYLADILHVISQALLVPVIALLLALIAYGLFCIGSVFSEYLTERRHFKVAMPKFLAALMAAKQDGIPAVIEESGLLNRQKTALLTVYDYRMLPGDALIALVKRLVNEEESRYDRIRSRNNTVARIAPMIGLMGTLIPLGPGIEALGRADTAALSSSLLIAFDTTVAGLIVAAVCMVVGKIRGNWYDNYLSALDAGMATMLEKIEEMRAAGEITTKEPTDYAFMFSKGFEPATRKKDGGKPEPKPASAAAEPVPAAPEPAPAAPESAPVSEPAQLQATAAAPAVEEVAIDSIMGFPIANEPNPVPPLETPIVEWEIDETEATLASSASESAVAESDSSTDAANLSGLEYRFEPPRHPR